MTRLAFSWKDGVMRGLGLLVALVILASACSTPDRGDRPTTRPTAPQKDPEPAVIRGRCIAAESGKPLAGCEVFLMPMWFMATPAFDNKSLPVFGRPLDYDSREFSAHIGSVMLDIEHEYRPHGRPFPDLTLDRYFMTARRLAEVRRKGKHYQRPPNAVTGADGRFELRCDPSDSSRWRVYYSVEVASPLRCPRRSGELLGMYLQSGERRDFGDVPLHLGIRVQGRVRDQDGEPVVGATLRLKGVPHKLGDESDFIGTASRREGRFAFEEPVPPGTYAVQVRAVGAKLLRPLQVIVGNLAVDVEVVVQTRPSISGVVVDEAGRPKRGTVLLAVGNDRKVYGGAVTDAQGRFRLRQEPESSPTVHVMTGYRFTELVDPPNPVRWGARGVRLEERKTRPVQLDVVNAVTGVPVTEDMLVTIQPLGPGTSPDLQETDSFFQLDGPHRGRLVLKYVRSGRHSFRVKLNGGDHMVPVTVKADLRYDGPRKLTVKMQPAVTLPVRVTNADGTPAAGARVMLARSGSWREAGPHWHNHPGYLTYGETNWDGRVWLRGAAAGMKVDVHVAGKIVKDILVAERMRPVRVKL